MENRFFEMDDYLNRVSGNDRPVCDPHSGRESYGYRAKRERPLYRSTLWSQPFSASDRALVILIENEGVDLGIPEVVQKLFSLIPQSNLIPARYRQELVEGLRNTLKEYTDNLIESFELSINRYSASKPDFFGDVVILRNGKATYEDLKNKLIALSRAGKIVDLIILTHGRDDYISVAGGINSAQIRAMKTENTKPLSIRSVYMMNCVASSLNRAWIDAGAKVSAGSRNTNYLPEPTTFFFWQKWKAGETFESAVTSAYKKTINLMNETVRGVLATVPVLGSLVGQIDFANFDFAKESAPLVEGQGTVTINTDNLSFAHSMSSGLVTTVLSVSDLPSQGPSKASAPNGLKHSKAVSPAGIDFIKGWEASNPYNGTELLGQKASQFQQIVNDSVKVDLNQNQNNALVSFAYNVGGNSFQKSTLLRLLNTGDYGSVPTELMKWTKARHNGKLVDLPALVKRRTAESELFQKPAAATAQSLSLSQENFPVKNSYVFESPSSVVTEQSHYSLAQNPAAAVIAGIEVADAAQIGLGAVSIVQAQASLSQGSFSLSFDKAQRMLTNEARVQMPGAQSAKKSYSRPLFFMGNSGPSQANAHVIIEWEGNPYGEIGTAIIRRDLPTSTSWSRSSANIVIMRVERIPLPNTDPRTWPIVYTYDGTYDPSANGYFEFSGEFEINAFGGLKFNRHQVVSRSMVEFLIRGAPEQFVVKGRDVVVAVPAIPQEQIDYLRTKLP